MIAYRGGSASATLIDEVKALVRSVTGPGPFTQNTGKPIKSGDSDKKLYFEADTPLPDRESAERLVNAAYHHVCTVHPVEVDYLPTESSPPA